MTDLGDAITARLGTRALGRPLVFRETTGSTMEDAKDLVRSGAHAGTVVVAAQQTAGRGRLGRAFVSPPGGLYLTAILAPGGDPALAWRCGFAAALAARDAIAAAGGPEVEFDWPNDLVLGERKVGGILMELLAPADRRTWPALLLGIGLNVGPDPRAIDPRAAGPAGPLRGFPDDDPRPAVAAALLERFEALLPACDHDAGWRTVLDAVRACSRASRGAPVAVRDAHGTVHAGRGIGIRDDGALEIRLADGTTEIIRYGDRVYDVPPGAPSS